MAITKEDVLMTPMDYDIWIRYKENALMKLPARAIRNIAHAAQRKLWAVVVDRMSHADLHYRSDYTLSPEDVDAIKKILKEG